MRIKQMIPMLESDDMEGTLAFYTEILGFKVFDTATNERGLYWCNVYRDDAEVMFTDRNAHSQEAKATFNGTLYFYPDNVDELWNELKDKVEIAWPPQDFGYGMYDFGIKDNNGFVLAFGQTVESRK